MAREFYDKQGITDKKVVVFSDSLNVESCLEYKHIAEEAGFQPVFGVGTYLTSKFLLPVDDDVREIFSLLTLEKSPDDFRRKSNGQKSVPLNIVIKIASAGGRPAVKLSDNLGKNTGDKALVQEVKKRLGYIENTWEQGDETSRWGKKGE
jgi:nicotinate phosphoribosyltransferase